MDQGIRDQEAERGLRRQVELGRLISAAAGYRVVAGDGSHLGWLDHVRYQQHADHLDEIVVRRRGLGRRRRAFSFIHVETVKPSQRTVVLRLGRVALERLPSDGATPGHPRDPNYSLTAADRAVGTHTGENRRFDE